MSIHARDAGLVAHRVGRREEEAPVIELRIAVCIARRDVLAPLDEGQGLADRGVFGLHPGDPQRSDREQRRGEVGVNMMRRRRTASPLDGGSIE